MVVWWAQAPVRPVRRSRATRTCRSQPSRSSPSSWLIRSPFRDMPPRLAASRHNNSCSAAKQGGRLASLFLHLQDADVFLAENQGLSVCLILDLRPPLGCPALLRNLTTTSDGQRIVGHILGNARSCANVRPSSNSHGGNKGSVAADECAVADHCLVFVHAIVVAGDGASSYVHVLPDFRITKIGKVVGF